MYLRAFLTCTMVLLALLSHLESRAASMVGCSEGDRGGLPIVRGIRFAATTSRDDDQDDDLHLAVNAVGSVAGCAPDGGERDDDEH